MRQPLYSRRVTPRWLRPSRPIAQLALVLVIGSATAALAGACGEGAMTITPTEDGGEESGSLQRADCPAAEPANGSLCLLPEGTTCDFGQCGPLLARCSQGVWTRAGNPTAGPKCPDKSPTEGVKCPACWPVTLSCPYGSTDCSLPDASPNKAVASCPAGTWVLDYQPCRDGGGADVQRDGGPDAD